MLELLCCRFETRLGCVPLLVFIWRRNLLYFILTVVHSKSTQIGWCGFGLFRDQKCSWKQGLHYCSGRSALSHDLSNDFSFLFWDTALTLLVTVWLWSEDGSVRFNSIWLGEEEFGCKTLGKWGGAGSWHFRRIWKSLQVSRSTDHHWQHSQLTVLLYINYIY